MLVRCLGSVHALDGDERVRLTGGQQKLLAILIAAGAEGLAEDRLRAECSDGSEDAWRKAKSRLRAAWPGSPLDFAGGIARVDLPEEAVDVWQLKDLTAASEVDDELARALLSGQPFEGVEETALIREETQAILAARVDLIRHLIPMAADLSPMTLHVIAILATRHTYREDLVCAAAELHLAAGRPVVAGQLAREGVSYLRDELLIEPQIGLLDVVKQTEGIDYDAFGVSPRAERIEPRVIGHSRLRDKNPGFVARQSMLTDIGHSLEFGSVLLTGDSGTGKTELASAVASAKLIDRHHVVWVKGRRDAMTAYGPFCAVDRGLAEVLEPLLGASVSEGKRPQYWNEALNYLETLLPLLPILVVVDDAQWFDSQSAQFIEFIAVQSGRPIRLLVNGRGDERSVDYNVFAANLIRAGLVESAMEPFSEAELVALAGCHYPSSSTQLRVGFARELVRLGAVVPAIATELVKQVDPETLTLPLRLKNNPNSALWVDQVDPDARAVAETAAVLGMTFRLGALSNLTDIGVEEALDAIDDLLDAELLDSDVRLDEFSFRHVLIQRAFEDSLSRRARRDLHLRAAALPGVDVHGRALHLVSAAGQADAGEVAEALLDSAWANLGSGLFREAAAAFSMADANSDGGLEAPNLLGYADAMDRSGADGWSMRERAFKLSSAAGDHQHCLEIALTSILETEAAVGDERRIAMLRSVESERLGLDERIARDAALARNLGLLDQHEEALRIANRAMKVADTADQSFTAWLGAWPSTLTKPVLSWNLPPDLNEVVSEELASRRAQVECLHALLRGDDEIARSKLTEFHDAPFTERSGMRTWYSLLLGSFFLFIDGDWKQASVVADAALVVGQQEGVAEAFSARSAQVFARHWMCGTHGQLLPVLDASAPDVAGSLLAQAAHLTAMVTDNDRLDEACRRMAEIMSRIRERQTTMGPAVAALLASTQSPHLLDGNVAELRSIIEPFAGTHLIFGSGIVSFGPASRALADLAFVSGETGRCEELLQVARDEADRWNLPAWSVRCRLDLHVLLDDPKSFEEAALHAAGLDLGDMLSAFSLRT